MFLLYFPFSFLCVLPWFVGYEQELLRSIHQELPLDRIRGGRASEHGPAGRHQFASQNRVHQVLRDLEIETNLPIFVDPFGVDMDNVGILLRVVTKWLVEKTDLQSNLSLHGQLF